MKCTVTIFHNVWRTVVVDSRQITDWFPAGFDAKLGVIVNVGDWRYKSDGDISAIKAFNDRYVDRWRLHDWISDRIQEKYHVTTIQERYCPIVFADEIVVEYDASFADEKHNFSVSITPMDEFKEGQNNDN